MSRISQLRDLLPKSIHKAGISRQFIAARVCQIFRESLKKINKKALSNCEPLYYRNRVLYVKCKSAAWANELQMQSHLLIEEINCRLKKNILERIQFKI
ncbi:MAG: DUF721 domain-containing protein [Patescibacteria group bacterium]